MSTTKVHLEARGFTLLEVIITIVVAAIVAAMLVPFMGSALTRSHAPLDNLRHAASLHAEMAKVVAEYKRDTPKDEGEMTAFKGSISEIVDSEVVDVVFNDLKMFDISTGVEGACVPLESLDCILKVHLRSVVNPGEKLITFFPYKR